MGRVCHTQSQFVWIDQRDTHRVDAASDVLIQIFLLLLLLSLFVEIPSCAVCAAMCAYAYHYYLNSSGSLRFSCLDTIVIALIVQISIVRVCVVVYLIIFISSFVISYLLFFLLSPQVNLLLLTFSLCRSWIWTFFKRTLFDWSKSIS